MPATLKPVDRPAGLAEQVYQTLRDHLLSHRLRPGERLQEATLAVQLGVSRTPVREALARLESEGLVAADGRSFAVPALADDDIEEIYELRELLEPAALARVARAAPAAERLVALEAALEDAVAADRAGEARAFSEANARFHAAWRALVANRRLLRALDLYAGHVRYLRMITLGDAAARRASLAGMRNILAALRRGDGERAAKAMHEHLATAKGFLREAMDGMSQGGGQAPGEPAPLHRARS